MYIFENFGLLAKYFVDDVHAPRDNLLNLTFSTNRRAVHDHVLVLDRRRSKTNKQTFPASIKSSSVVDTSLRIMAGIAVGLNKGHVVTKRTPALKPAKAQKGKMSARGQVVREVMMEVCGFAPYEKRLIELLRIGKDKRALKFAKKRLGTHLRAKRKREEMSEALRSKRG